MITVINMKILIYYEDDNIIVCEKPRGVISQKSDKNCMPGLLSRQSGAEIYPVHRLDTDTTGVMVFAKNKKTVLIIVKLPCKYTATQNSAFPIPGTYQNNL